MYISTRSGCSGVSGARALLAGLASDGGLYVPDSYPAIPPALFSSPGLSYGDLAFAILAPFFHELDQRALCAATRASAAAFPADPAPLVSVGGLAFLELYHGPTLAFKDFALSIMGDLVSLAAAAEGETDNRLILVATSGDTGKAALAGFSGRPGIRVLVFYPEAGVSGIQRLQMLTHDPHNAAVVGIQGNFDDAQRGVKALFSDAALAAELASRGIKLGSANSINIGRLLPQIVYYAWAYRSALAQGLAVAGSLIDFVVPTGNFGDALAAHYARKMGIPIGRIIVATNRNRVLADFLSNGRYDRNRPFHATTSPSMDILAASNLERLLFDLSQGDPARVAGLMQAFAREGFFELSPEERAGLAGFACGSASDEEGAAEIRAAFAESGYLMDTHTAIGAAVLRKLAVAEGGRPRPAIVVSTASPFKFPIAVSKAIGLGLGGPELAVAAALARHAGLDLPGAVSALGSLPIRHRLVVEADGMRGALLASLDGGSPHAH